MILCLISRLRVSRLGGRRIGGQFLRGQRYAGAKEREQPLLVPTCPGVAEVSLVMTDLGAPDAVVGLEQEFDVEGGVVLLRDRCLERTSRELTRLPGPILAGDAFGGDPSRGGDLFRTA